MTTQQKRKTLTNSVKKDLENKEKIVDDVLKHVQTKETEYHNARILEKEKATFYMDKKKIERLEDLLYRLKKEYPGKKRRINKSTILEVGLDLVIEECEKDIKSHKIYSLLNKM